jgi:hypothetical protein
VIGVHECLRRPQPGSHLLSSNNLARTLQQHGENLERLVLDFYLATWLNLHKGTKCEIGIYLCFCRRYGCLVFATPKKVPI